MPFWAGSRPALAFVLLAVGLAPPLYPRTGAVAGSPSAAQAKNDSNSTATQEQHYVVLVSLDGFRWDYAQRDGAAHLLALARQGAWAPQGMLPGYPALGLPNRYTIITGLYPGHHGVVADSFYDPERKAHFSADDAKNLADGSWFGGVPLWSLAESQGMRTAAIAWPGCQAEIAGFRPNYLARGGDAAAQKAEQQVLHWLRLPAPVRPHLIAVDFSEPADEARRFGPDSTQAKAAVLHADALVGRLQASLGSTGLPVDLVVVSDRGMAKSESGWITLDQFASLAGFATDGPLFYGPTEEQREHVYRQLNHVSSLFVVYRRKDLPPDMHMSLNPRIGDPVVIATGAATIRAKGPGVGQADAPPPAGVDGLDPQAEPQMKATFFAVGPDILPGRVVAPFENVNLYPWIAHLLGLKPPKSDGSLNILAGILRDDGAEPHGEAKR
jgi:hypothetical protein